MLQFKTLSGLAVVLAGALAIACNEAVGPDTAPGGRGASLSTVATAAIQVPDNVTARGTLNPGVRIMTHPNRPIDVVSALIRLDGDGDGLVNGNPAPDHVRWHTHPGPTMGVVTGGAGAAMTLYHAGSCAQHVYAVGDAFVPPVGTHSAWNKSGTDLILRATFLLPVGAPPTVFAPAEFTDCGLP